MRSSLMIGYCWRTSAAASRPSSTSCWGVYLFFGSLIAVCAARVTTAMLASTIEAIARFTTRMGVRPDAAAMIESCLETAHSSMARRREGRLPSLDVLRGLALLGMFIVHFHARSSEPGGIDDVIRTLIWRLVESKSHGTFALLFGAGFAIQLRRAEARGLSMTGLYLRRLGVLAAF